MNSNYPLVALRARHRCEYCHAPEIVGVDPVTETVAPFFHPREQDWESNFSIDTPTGMMFGLSASARATVIRLHMNSQAQVTARQQWIALGLFP